MKKLSLPSFLPVNSLLGIRWRAMIWLVMAFLMTVLLILLWMYGKTAVVATEEAQIDEPKEKGVATVKAINVTKRIETLDDLADDVAPIKFETIVRDLREYPDEFKDKVYLGNRSAKWTVQVMDVAEHEVITDYLDGRDDREKFAYFRFSDKNDKSRYMLIYDEVASFDEAKKIVKEIDFGLPNTVRVTPEEMSRYISMVDNYERAESVLDMSSNRPRSVILRPTRREVPVKRATTANRSTRSNTTSNLTTKTTNTAKSTTKKTTSTSAKSDSKKAASSKTAKANAAKKTGSSSNSSSKPSTQPAKTAKSGNSTQASTQNKTAKPAEQVVKKTNTATADSNTKKASKQQSNTAKANTAETPVKAKKAPAEASANTAKKTQQPKASEERKPRPFVPNAPPQ